MQTQSLYELQAEMAYRQEHIRQSIKRRPKRRFRHDRAGAGSAARASADARA